MDSVKIKSYGTPEELKLIEEVCNTEGIMCEFDEDGQIYLPEDYTFGRGGIDGFVRKIVSKVPNAKFMVYVSYEDNVSGQHSFTKAEYDTNKLTLKGTGWYYPPVDKEYYCEDEDRLEGEFTYCGNTYLWRKGFARPKKLENENEDGFLWYGTEYKWDYVEETLIKGASEVKIKAIATDVSELNDFGALLLAKLPLDISSDDIRANFKGDFGSRSGNIFIESIRYGVDRKEVDKLAESLSVIMPGSKYVVFAEFKDGDKYKYVYKDGELLCGREIETDKYERVDLVPMTEEERKDILFDENKE